jgi:hypothetical protein
MARKNAHWTNLEIRRLTEMHADARRPPAKEVAAAFPRHPAESVMHMARRLGLRRKRVGPLETDVTRWLRVAHQHFERREAGHLA